MPHNSITNENDLRGLYAQPMERARLKTLKRLDVHCRNFIARSPFVCLGTCSDAGADVTPRGDEPGFVHILNDTTLAIPDWPGNNRLDSFSNIVKTSHVGLLFFIPGVQETLRVNGVGEIATDSDLVEQWNRDGKHPKLALIVTIREAFLHCGKALIRARLWQDDYKIKRTDLPPYGAMLKDQTKIDGSAEEIQADVENGYKNRLY